MKRHFLSILILFCFYGTSKASDIPGIESFGVKPGNSPAVNKANLQKAIDWASKNGTALFVDPTDEPYPIDGGIILKKNVSLIGVNGPTPRGTVNPSKKQPVGSVFKITDKENVFITVESGTQIREFSFGILNKQLMIPWLLFLILQLFKPPKRV